MQTYLEKGNYIWIRDKDITVIEIIRMVDGEVYITINVKGENEERSFKSDSRMGKMILFNRPELIDVVYEVNQGNKGSNL